MSEQRFEYYAFISYNHRDLQAAVKLQRQLQRYRLPSAFAARFPERPKHLSPVFLDQTDLVAHETSLSLSLQSRLEASNYLIVLCSPHSATSPWVNAEVEWFLSHGRKDRIIPVILSGTPHAEDPARECYPPSLASLPAEEELLGISVADYGWHGTFLRVLATILRLKLDAVVRRDAAYRRRKRLLAAIAVLAVATAAFSVLWYNTPHTSYFLDVVYRWAAPEGVYPVSSSEKNRLSQVWKLTTLRGKVVQAERVNSADQLIDDEANMSNDPPMEKIVYASDGKVSRLEFYDLYRRPLFTLEYSANLRTADFVYLDSGNAYSLTSDLSAVLTPENSTLSHTDIIRYVSVFDEETGFETERMFKRDNRGTDGGTPAADATGAWGQRFEYNEHGQLLRAWILDRDRQVTETETVYPYAETEYTYDASGRLASFTYLSLEGAPVPGLSGYCSLKFVRDVIGNLSELRAFADSDSLETDTPFRIHLYRHDESGFLTLFSARDETGSSRIAEDGAYSIQYDRDAFGRISRRTLCNAQGKPESTSVGYAIQTFCYNDAGQVTEEYVYHPDGSPAIDRSYESVGLRFSYDDHGLLTRLDYVDSTGTLMQNKYGYASWLRFYDKNLQLVRMELHDENDRLVNGPADYAAIEYIYEDGHLIDTRYVDLLGRDLKTLPSVLVINEVDPGSWAESAGLVVGNLVLRCGSWTVDRIAENPESWFSEFNDVMINERKEGVEVPMVVCSVPESGDPVVSVLLLPNSYMGLGVADHKVEPEQYESLRQLWHLWQEEN